MNLLKKTILPVLASTIWISLSEFTRNTFILHDYWTSHFQSLGLVFPEKPMNGAIWGLWSLCFAVLVFIILKKFSLLQTTFIAWFAGFLCMWVATGNLLILPIKILPIAIPLSVFEAYLAGLIIQKMR